jgi:hypothetical protein
LSCKVTGNYCPGEHTGPGAGSGTIGGKYYHCQFNCKDANPSLVDVILPNKPTSCGKICNFDCGISDACEDEHFDRESLA